MAEQDLDRNEEATPHKLQKARERGQVSKSSEVVSALVLTVAVTFLYWKGWDGLQSQFRYDHALLARAGRIDVGQAGLWTLISGMVSDTMVGLTPFFVALLLSAILGNLVQTGPVLSLEPLKFDFDRLNPVNGFRRVLSLRTLFDGARAIAKLLLLSLVVYHAVMGLAPQFPRLASLPPAKLARAVLDDVASAGMKIALILCLIAFVDYVFTRREFAKKMRMSRRDVKDEHKHREGDPRIRARLRELRREALRRSMATRKTSTADVLLTNPTHVAVALRYVHGEMASPQVVAKGAGSQATGMRKIAAKHHIPIVQNPPLARQLFRDLDVEQHVPPELYAQVARILVWVFAQRQTQHGRVSA